MFRNISYPEDHSATPWQCVSLVGVLSCGLMDDVGRRIPQNTFHFGIQQITAFDHSFHRRSQLVWKTRSEAQNKPENRNLTLRVKVVTLLVQSTYFKRHNFRFEVGHFPILVCITLLFLKFHHSLPNILINFILNFIKKGYKVLHQMLYQKPLLASHVFTHLSHEWKMLSCVQTLPNYQSNGSDAKQRPFPFKVKVAHFDTCCLQG